MLFSLVALDTCKLKVKGKKNQLKATVWETAVKILVLDRAEKLVTIIFLEEKSMKP